MQYIDNEKLYEAFELHYGHKPKIKDTTELVEAKNGVTYITYSIFDELDFVRQGFSTRIGGVSEGIYSSMNLTFSRDDAPDNVKRNFELMGQALGIEPENMVYSKQTHTTNVLKVSGEHRGLGVTKKHIYDDVDGLITNEPNVCLVTAYADCIPVIVADPVNKAIGAAHAGWKGTVGNIVNNIITYMSVEYGTKPEDIKAFVGPGICEGCYEVSEDVFLAFAKAYSDEELKLITRKGIADNKYQLNLPMANVINLYNTGVNMSDIAVADICTCCNPDLLFSHRATKGQRGILCNFIEII